MRLPAASAVLLAVSAAVAAPAARADAASEPALAERIKIAVLDLAPNGVPPELASSLTGVVANELTGLGVFSVISRDDIRAMLSHEAARQAAGCDAGSSCLADIGGALGVRYLVSGSVGQVGSEYVVNMSLSDVETAKVPGRVAERVKDKTSLVDVIDKASDKLVATVLDSHQAEFIVTCSEVGATVKVDGRIVGVTPLTRQKIGWGPHVVEVEKQGFVTGMEEFTVRTKGIVEKSVALIPSPDFLNAYNAGAGKMRLGAWLTTAAAAIALGGAGYFQYGYATTASQFDAKLTAYDSPAVEKTQAAWQELSNLKSAADVQVRNAQISGGLGLVFAAAATYFWIAGDDPGRYARYRLADASTGSTDGETSLFAQVKLDLLGPAGVVGASVSLP